MSTEEHTQCQGLLNFEHSLSDKGWHHLCIQLQLLLCIPPRTGRQYHGGADGTPLPFVYCLSSQADVSHPCFSLYLAYFTLLLIHLYHHLLCLFHPTADINSIFLDTSVHSFPRAEEIAAELYYFQNSHLHFYSAF